MLKTIHKKGKFKLFEYTPTVFKPVYVAMEPLTFFKRLRYLSEYRHGYKVYYLQSGKVIVASCAVTSGKNPRYFFAGNDDVIIGPYYVDPAYRGHQYTYKMLRRIFEKRPDIKTAYVMIKNTNIPSIKTAQKLGGKLIMHVHNTKIKKLIRKEDGEYGIYKIDRDFNDNV